MHGWYYFACCLEYLDSKSKTMMIKIEVWTITGPSLVGFLVRLCSNTKCLQKNVLWLHGSTPDMHAWHSLCVCKFSMTNDRGELSLTWCILSLYHLRKPGHHELVFVFGITLRIVLFVLLWRICIILYFCVNANLLLG